MINVTDVRTDVEGKEGGFRAKEKADEVSFVELYEQTLQDIPYGEIIKGIVVQINSDYVMVDVGYKTEGQVRIEELKDDCGQMMVEVGDEIDVLVDQKREDNLVLSKDKADKMKVWDTVITSHEGNNTIEGTIVRKVKGGLSVDIGFPAFLPGSQVDVRPIKDLDQFIGKTMDFQVLKYDRKRNNVVLSRRAIVESELAENRQKVLESLEEGKIVEGVVKNITDYGIFIDLGGIDGLLHLTDMSWGRIRHPADRFKVGEEIKVKILNFDREKERVSLGLKQLTQNPWDIIEEKYPVASIVEGRVVNIVDYGAFVELEEGIEGLIHVSEMFWTKRVKHPSKIISIGETVKVMVLEVSQENKRISLGLKQVMENPWKALKEKYLEGMIIKGKIRNITDFGLFVRVEDDIDGLVHISDISWKKRVKHPSEFYKKGDEIEAVVLHIDVENEKFSLGIKQLEQNPWEKIRAQYQVGSVVTGHVTNVTDFGIFVEIEEGVEGLVHISELSQKKGKSAEEMYSVGDSVSALIKNIDSENQKIGLSIKEFEIASDESSMNRYVNNRDKVTSNLGDILAGFKV